MISSKKHIVIRPLILIISTLVFIGCNTVKYVPDDSYLLNKLSVEIDNESINKSELKTHIRQEENLKILGVFRFHLWLYNLSKKKKEEGWFKRIGEPPVIYDPLLKEKSREQIRQYIYNKGYYNAVVSDTVFLEKKKAKLVFQVKTGQPYIVRDVGITIKDKLIAPILTSTLSESLVKKGDVFDVDNLNKERSRITAVMQNNGYYKFVEEYVHFKVDSAFNKNEIKVDLIVEKSRNSTNINQEQPHKKFTVEKYLIYVDRSKRSLLDNVSNTYNDTTQIENFIILHNGELELNPFLFINAIELKPQTQYSKSLVDKTYNNLYSLRQFKYVNIQFHELENKTDSVQGYLTGILYLPLQVKQNYSVDVEGTTTSGNLGVAGLLSYQHKNLFGGAEIFDITFKGASERQMTIDKTIFNTLEYGGTAKLSVPWFLFPMSKLKPGTYTMPFTSLSMAYNFQERPEYVLSIVNATFGYRWKSKPEYNHNLNLFDLNAVQIFRISPEFENSIKDLFIKSSYSDHIISASSYVFTYTDQGLKKQPDYHYLRMNIETAGNTLWMASTLLGIEKTPPNNLAGSEELAYYKIFDTRFAHYLKSDFDFRYGYRLDKYNAFATRGFLGIAYPYGNFNVIPIERRYFSGGANGIRAWQVRTLGPGSYLAKSDEGPYQSADIKLEASVEYRFKLFWMLEGALFVDAGNIWAINGNDNRVGALFQFNKFYNEIAVGTGLGLRLVYTYFILRADLGLKLRDPSLPVGTRFIPATRMFNMGDLGLNIAIGYPF